MAAERRHGRLTFLCTTADSESCRYLDRLARFAVNQDMDAARAALTRLSQAISCPAKAP